MKTTKIKNLLALTAILFASAGVSAQEIKNDGYDEGFRLGFGLNVGYMLEEPFNGLALGGDVRLQYDLSKRTSLTLTTGYNYLPIENDYEDVGFRDISMIPVKAGFKAFFWEDQFYALGEAGAGFVVSNNSPFDEDTSFLISPGIGYANKYFDVSLRYEHYTAFETGQLAVRFAYGFRL